MDVKRGVLFWGSFLKPFVLITNHQAIRDDVCALENRRRRVLECGVCVGERNYAWDELFQINKSCSDSMATDTLPTVANKDFDRRSLDGNTGMCCFALLDRCCYCSACGASMKKRHKKKRFPL